MKKVLFIFLFLINLNIVQGQYDSDRTILTSIDKKRTFYIDLNEQSGTVYQLGRWIDPAGSAWSIIHTDTIESATGKGGLLFSGKKTAIRKLEGKLYVMSVTHKGRVKMTRIDTIGNTHPVTAKINNAYWWTNFLKMSDSLNARFTSFHYTFRYGFGLWNSFHNKEIPFREFRIYADNKLKQIRDSIATVHTPYDALTNETVNTISTIDYSLLKENVAKLATDDLSKRGYLFKIINSICINRPELFFKLADDMPDKRQNLFYAVDGKTSINNLKAVETSSPSKKEFFRQKKIDRRMTIGMIGAAVAGAALLAFSMIVLIK
ncbi:MAG: hypothetical protein ABI480_06760 [Chitinophagaceae bacterium]